MDIIGNHKIRSYFDNAPNSRTASNSKIRSGTGHPVNTYFDLAMKMAELQFFNRSYVFMFRGQHQDHKTTKNNSMFRASIFRHHKKSPPKDPVLKKRFDKLRLAESLLVQSFQKNALTGRDQIKRHPVTRWAILQHYEVCRTPLFDVTSSLRIAASFASNCNPNDEAFVYAFGVPNLSGAITVSSETGIQIVRLSSACPPSAVRPHIQEGYLLGEYPEINDIRKKVQFKFYEIDFGRILIAKFRLKLGNFWNSKNFPRANNHELYPSDKRDDMLQIIDCIKESIDQ